MSAKKLSLISESNESLSVRPPTGQILSIFGFGLDVILWRK
jgi:hypothetical protein